MNAPSGANAFFHDAAIWDALREQVLPRVLAETNGHPIRAWSVGCATGQEPYALAIQFAEAVGLENLPGRLHVFATDLDQDALRIARDGRYGDTDMQTVPPLLKDRYFQCHDGMWEVVPALRACVSLGRHDIVRDAPLTRIDLILCRDLLLYLEARMQDRVLPRLHHALKTGGFLVLGEAETQLARTALFRPLDRDNRIFTKPDPAARITDQPDVTSDSRLCPVK